MRKGRPSRQVAADDGRFFAFEKKPEGQPFEALGFIEYFNCIFRILAHLRRRPRLKSRRPFSGK